MQKLYNRILSRMSAPFERYCVKAFKKYDSNLEETNPLYSFKFRIASWIEFKLRKMRWNTN